MRALLLLVLLILSAQCATAAPALVRADPTPDSVASVIQIELHFSETLQAGASSIAMFDREGQPVAGAAIFGGKTLFFRMELPPQPGVYEVRWRATSAGGEVSEGRYRFTQEYIF